MACRLAVRLPQEVFLLIVEGSLYRTQTISPLLPNHPKTMTQRRVAVLAICWRVGVGWWLLISKIMDGDVPVLVRLYLEVALLGLDDVVLDDVGDLVAALHFGLVVGPRGALHPAPDVLLRFALRAVGVVGDVRADLRLVADVVAHRPALLLHLAPLLRLLPAQVALGRVLCVEGAQVVALEGGALELCAVFRAALRFFVEGAHGLHFLLLVRPLLACFPLDPKGAPLLLVGLLGQGRLGLWLLQLLGALLFAGLVCAEGHILVHGLHELDEFRDCL